MNKITAILLAVGLFYACEASVDYKKVRDEVMSFHDVVMSDHGVIVGNQMKLDTLIGDLKGLKSRFPEVDTLKERLQMLAIKNDLIKAEEDMNIWMHEFEPDVSSKSNEEAVKYFQQEKLKIAAVDSLYKAEIALSNAYLNKFK